MPNLTGDALRAVKQIWTGISPATRWRAVLGALVLAVAASLIFNGVPDRPDIGEGTRWKVRDYLAYYSWWGLVGSGVILTGLAAACPWWAGRPVQPAPMPTAPAPGIRPWLVAAACVFSAACAWPRMGYSLWDDEEHTVRRYVVGELEAAQKDAPRELKPVSWLRTFYDYRKPNNHIPLSALARVCHEAWRTLFPDDPRLFSEFALRLPSLLFGVAAVIAAAWLGSLLGAPWSGVGASWLLALHPWHLRYTSELRGYSMAMFLVALTAGLWALAIRGGRWRAWAGFAAAHGCMVYTYPGTLFFGACLNALTPLVFWAAKDAATPRPAALGRWFCCSALAAAVMVPVMLPLVPQMALYLKSPEAVGTNLGAKWFADVGSSFVGGVCWVVGKVGKYPQMSAVAADAPILFWSVAGGLALAFVAGWFAVAKRSRVTTGLVVATLGAVGATLGHSALKGQFLHVWYLVQLLPLFALLAACGAAWLIGFLPGRISRGAAAAGLLALYAAATQPPRLWYMGWPVAPLRDSAETVARMLAAGGEGGAKPILAGIGLAPVMYEPRMIVPRDAGHLLALMERADRQGRPLVVNTGHAPYERLNGPQKFRLLRTRELFREWFRMDGYDPPLDRRIFRYNPGSLAKYDASWVNRSGQ